ncbi:MULTISPECIES: four-carbon acid sugar kinase family protein [unclassified Caballeronia]|uniref:four-carbon acid sugar kinase family protein n=1 Tax=unclassified Caballeronia TaxID=2646786 RepID=UPI001F221EE3|nr:MULTISPECIES: four-carbon acid sugar kinase family protein [unclassified Caballeronia]MCE4547270.1 four-carbon acid sugar kinase family protein [Caballeronia sp. PC1]MCE4575252.1 four-carbon acid sugar kinase family protein [Caballeronia sp. CLC5]
MHGASIRHRPRCAPIAFYGDDFTGAAANLLEFHRRGLRGILFVETPNFERFKEVTADLDVAGVAGIARSLPPHAMAAEIEPALKLFEAAGARVIQYKICATFDSSPEQGSFGTVLELARQCLGVQNVPIVAAHPDFGRYTAFGHHFATYRGEVFRLDRHPSMAAHPATPMHEADLRVHLARQTSLPIGICDFTELRRAPVDRIVALIDQLDANATTAKAATLFDAIEAADLRKIAHAVWYASARRPLFAIASHGLAAGLAAHLSEQRPQSDAGAPQRPVDSIVVLSGSCTPHTAAQIAYARSQGWLVRRLALAEIAVRGENELADSLALEICNALERKQSVVICTAAGLDDTSIARGTEVCEQLGAESSALIGALYGAVLRRVSARRRLPRFVVAGGDTSSQTMRRLGIDALSVDAINPTSQDAFMRIHAADPALNGAQVLLKAGQNGDDDHFVLAREGRHWR